jgi:hypothetical protein
LSNEQLETTAFEDEPIVAPKKQRSLTTNVEVQPKQKYSGMVRSLNDKQRFMTTFSTVAENIIVVFTRRRS